MDLSHNCLDENDSIEDVLAFMPSLRVLILMGNPIVRKIANYRFNPILKALYYNTGPRLKRLGA